MQVKSFVPISLETANLCLRLSSFEGLDLQENQNKCMKINQQRQLYKNMCIVKSARLYFLDCCSAVLIYYTTGTKCLRLFHSNNHSFVLEETGISSLNETSLKYFTCMLSTTFDFLCMTLAQTTSVSTLEVLKVFFQHYLSMKKEFRVK